jgi:hypothetical protein
MFLAEAVTLMRSKTPLSHDTSPEPNPLLPPPAPNRRRKRMKRVLYSILMMNEPTSATTH